MSFESEVRQVILGKISERLQGETIDTPQDGKAKIFAIETDNLNGIPVLFACLQFRSGTISRFCLEANISKE